jgi:hypothetical protein
MAYFINTDYYIKSHCLYLPLTRENDFAELGRRFRSKDESKEGTINKYYKGNYYSLHSGTTIKPVGFRSLQTGLLENCVTHLHSNF